VRPGIEVEQFLRFIKRQHGRMARVGELTSDAIQAWMDAMAGADLGLETMRVRQSVLSSFCAWLVKRGVLPSNRDAALFLILRYTGMRRESVPTLQVRHLDGASGLRGVRVEGGKTRDIPLPTAVTQYPASPLPRCPPPASRHRPVPLLDQRADGVTRACRDIDVCHWTRCGVGRPTS